MTRLKKKKKEQRGPVLLNEIKDMLTGLWSFTDADRRRLVRLVSQRENKNKLRLYG